MDSYRLLDDGDFVTSREWWDKVNKLQDKKQDKAFIEWIKSQPCYFGGKVVEAKGFPYFCDQSWDYEKGEFHSDPSHILKKGSTRRNEHLGNLFPNCRRHHIWFEGMPPIYRNTFKEIGKEYYERWLSE